MAPVLNRQFVLEAASTSPDGSGGFVDAWVVLGTLWGELKGIGGRDVDVDTAAVSQGRFRITVRASAPTSSERPIPGQRFREGTRTFPILAVVDSDPKGRWLTCVVREEAQR